MAQLHGSDAHGAVQLPLYITGLLDGTIKRSPSIVRPSICPAASSWTRITVWAW